MSSNGNPDEFIASLRRAGAEFGRPHSSRWIKSVLSGTGDCVMVKAGPTHVCVGDSKLGGGLFGHHRFMHEEWNTFVDVVASGCFDDPQILAAQGIKSWELPGDRRRTRPVLHFWASGRVTLGSTAHDPDEFVYSIDEWRAFVWWCKQLDAPYSSNLRGLVAA